MIEYRDIRMNVYVSINSRIDHLFSASWRQSTNSLYELTMKPFQCEYIFSIFHINSEIDMHIYLILIASKVHFSFLSPCQNKVYSLEGGNTKYWHVRTEYCTLWSVRTVYCKVLNFTVRTEQTFFRLNFYLCAVYQLLYELDVY